MEAGCVRLRILVTREMQLAAPLRMKEMVCLFPEALRWFRLATIKMGCDTLPSYSLPKIVAISEDLFFLH